MDAHAFVLLVFACLAVNLSPGPSVLLVTSLTAARGTRAGLFAVLGMSAGALIHVLLAASGVAAALAAAPLAFAIVQYLGAAYLIYLGIDLLRPGRSEDEVRHSHRDTNAWRYFRRGFLVDSLNPKIALFFLAFIPQFLASVESPGFLTSVALGSVFLVTGAIVNGSLACLVGAGVRKIGGGRADWLRRWLPGGILVYLGLRLLWQEN